MEKITKEILEKLDGRSLLMGAVLIRRYSKNYTKSGSPYYVGTLASEKEVTFKVWDNSPAYPIFDGNDLTNKVCYIEGNGNEYQGTVSVIINVVKPCEEYTLKDFVGSPYNIPAVADYLRKQFENGVSDKAKAIANKVLFENTEVWERFKDEQAGASHHDSCIGGLLAHTTKVLALMEFVIRNYTSLVSNTDGTLNQDMVDLLKMGVLFHDIGKIKEMNYGVYQPESIVTHRYLGIEMLPKDDIIASFGEEFWLNLVSIMLQHHGEYGERPKTLAAYLTHICDNMEAQLTTISDGVKKPTEDSVGLRIKVDDYYLAI